MGEERRLKFARLAQAIRDEYEPQGYSVYVNPNDEHVIITAPRKKPPTVTESPRQIRDRVNGFRKD